MADLTARQMESREQMAYAEVDGERARQRPSRGYYAFLRRDGTIGFARCQTIKNAGAALNAETSARFVSEQLPSDGACWLEEIAGR